MFQSVDFVLSRIFDGIFFCFDISLGPFLFLWSIFFISSLFFIGSSFSISDSFFVIFFLLYSFIFGFLKLSFHFSHPCDILKEILEFTVNDKRVVVLIVEFILFLSKLILFIPMLLFLIADSLEIFIKLIQNFIFRIFVFFKFVDFNLEFFQLLKDFGDWALNFLGLGVDWVDLLLNGVSLFDMRFGISDHLLSLDNCIFHLEIARLSF